jgi:hypothetical protein
MNDRLRVQTPFPAGAMVARDALRTRIETADFPKEMEDVPVPQVQQMSDGQATRPFVI